MIKEEMPNFRLDLTIMEIGEKRLTVLFQEKITSEKKQYQNILKPAPLQKNFNQKKPILTRLNFNFDTSNNSNNGSKF